MPDHSVRILAVSGSLRAGSSNTTLLRAAMRLAPEGVRVDLYERLDALPLFNPDRESELYEEVGSAPRFRADLDDPGLAAVKDLNVRVRGADGLLISCPEYAGGVPGAFKNALDWLVGGDAFVAKPFALFNASPRATRAQAALRMTLETMSGWMVDDACATFPLRGRGLASAAIVSEEALAKPIRAALAAFASAIDRRRREADRDLTTTCSETWEPATDPEDLARFFVARANAGDVEGLVALYERDAVLAGPAGQLFSGADAIRRFYRELLADRTTFQAGEQRTAVRLGDLALTSSRLVNGVVTAEVARQQPDGAWLWALDQPAVAKEAP